MRFRTLAATLSVATLTAPCALAQGAGGGSTFDAASVVEAFLTDPGALGAQSATVGSVSSSDDVITADNAEIRWDGELSTPDGAASYAFVLSAPSLEIANLARGGEGFSADRVTMPELNLSLDISGLPEPFSYELNFSDYEVTGAQWATLPQIQSNPAAPIARFAPLVDWALSMSYEANTVADISGTMETADGTSDLAYGAISVGPVNNGVVERFEYGEISATQTVDMAGEEGEAVPSEITVTYGPTVGENMDLKALAAFLTGIGSDGSPQTFVSRITMDNISVAAANDMFRFSMGPSVLEDYTLDPASGPLMTKADALFAAALNEEEPDPAFLIDTMLDIYGAIGIGRFSLGDVNVTTPDGSATLADFSIEGLSSAGLDRIALSGIEVDGMGGSGSLGLIELAGFVFPDRDAVVSAMMGSMVGMQPTPTAVMNAVPYLDRITVQDVNVTGPTGGTFNLDRFETTASDFIDPIPTQLSLALEGLSMPVSMIGDPVIQMMAGSLGLDTISAEGTIDLGWDEGTQEVTLDQDLTVGGIGVLQSAATLSGIPRFVFAEPARAQEALVTAAVNDINLRFEDQGLTSVVLGFMSQQSGVSTQDFILGISQQIALQVGMMTGDSALAENLSAQIQTFLSDPQSLTVSASPANPVPLAQVMGAAMTSPAALPDLINFDLQANQ